MNFYRNIEYSSFKTFQINVIMHTLNNGDSMVVQETGSGKSICFQIPPLYACEPALIISPLNSLINNQISKLSSIGLKCTNLKQGKEQVTLCLQDPLCLYIYASPEILESAGTIDMLENIRKKRGISCIAIDEAHCVVEWGAKFRPEYGRLSTLRDKFPNIPIIALTATATADTQRLIVNKLKLGQKKHLLRSFIGSNNRVNLTYRIMLKTSPQIDLCDRKYYANGSTIIYCPGIAESNFIANELQKQNITSCSAYNGGFTDTKRNEIQSDWENGKIQCIVSTIAFGMGIDKSDIRHILHYGSPDSVEAYTQHCGRAGRDGKPAECTLFYKDAEFDSDTLKKLSSSQQRSKWQMRQFIKTTTCRVQFILKYFGETSKNCINQCDNCIKNIRLYDDEKKTNESDINSDFMNRINSQVNALNDFLETINDKNTLEEELVMIDEIKRSLVSFQSESTIEEDIDMDMEEKKEIASDSKTQNLLSLLSESISDHESDNDEIGDIIVKNMDVIQSMQHSGAVFENFGCGKVITPGQAVNDIAHNQNQNVQLTSAQPLLALPSLNESPKTNFQLNINHNSNRLNEETWQNSTIIATNSVSSNSRSVQRSFNNVIFGEKKHLIDFDAVRKAAEKLRKNKEQRGRSKIDSTTNIKEPMKNYKWIKHSRTLGKDIIRFVMITVSEGGGRVKGLWMEMTNDTWHPINKKFILDINQRMRKDILKHFWGFPEQNCGSNYLETINILCTKFGFTVKPVRVIDMVMEQMRKICIYLKKLNKFDVANLVHKRLLENSAMSKRGAGFIEVYELFETKGIFLSWMSHIWEYLLCGMIAAKNMEQFNDIYFTMVNNWYKQE
eukprot:9191_1